MSYLVLARKYRPQKFEDLVGQEHVTTTLKNALAAKRLAHAYIFSGPRGCGKTTTARLLAMALNCESGPTASPCGKCAQCADIISGSSSDDVLEIDGASNRGIDQIRELRDTVKYSPARSRHRIYIIDEAHQITEAGFNALLKTLEEPPAHAVFMMATTEMQDIPATILSRCQRFTLRPIPALEIEAQLARIMKKESLKAEPAALKEVARAAHGSLRDALSLLDQLIAYAPENITPESIRQLLGVLPWDTVKDFAGVLRRGEPEPVLQAVDRVVGEGIDLFQLGQDLKDFWHQALLWKCGLRDLGGSRQAEIEEAAGFYEFATLERNLRRLSRGLMEMRRSESPRVSFELLALELAQNAISVEELLDRLGALENRLGAFPAPAAPKAPRAPAALNPSSPAPSRRQDFSPPPEPPAPKPDASAAGNWALLLEEVGRRKQSLATFLDQARVDESGGELTIVCAQEFQHQQISGSMALIREILKVPVKCVLEASAKSAPEPAPPAPASPEKPGVPPLFESETPPAAFPPAELPSGDIAPELQKVMKQFPGKLRKIEGNP